MASDEAFTPLNMIKTYKEGMKVRVQVFILWHQRYMTNPSQVASVDMILLDHQGNKIVTSVRPFMYPDFQETLQEGNFVDITNFGVDPYKGDYRLIDHEAKLVLFRTSKVSGAVKRCNLRKKEYYTDLEQYKAKYEELRKQVNEEQNKGNFMKVNTDANRLHTYNVSQEFSKSYAQWLTQHFHLTGKLKQAIYSGKTETEIKPLVHQTASQFHKVFRIKQDVCKADVFHIVYGTWTSLVERCIMWIGGFRPSDIIKVDASIEQQKKTYCLLAKTINEEKGLLEGMTRLQDSISDTMLWDTVTSSPTSPKMTTYMSQMSKAMGNLGAVEDYLHRADSLRGSTLVNIHEILTTRQSALAWLAISDYYARLTALSTLWVARPRESQPT